MTDIKKGFRPAGGDVSSYRKETAARAKAQGYTKSTKGLVDTYTKDGMVVVVTHSAKHYVQQVTVNGKVVIKSGEKEKFNRLQPILDPSLKK